MGETCIEFEYPPECSDIQPNYSVQEVVASVDSILYMDPRDWQSAGFLDGPSSA